MNESFRSFWCRWFILNVQNNYNAVTAPLSISFPSFFISTEKTVAASDTKIVTERNRLSHATKQGTRQIL